MASFVSRAANRLVYDSKRLMPPSWRTKIEACKHYGLKIAFYEKLGSLLGQPPLYVDEGPVQSREIALATSALTERNVREATDYHRCFSGAYGAMLLFLGELEAVDFPIGSVRAILDFGCGSGKYIRLFRSMPEVTLLATDINLLCVEWCQANITGVLFYLNDRSPPLRFIADNSMDLVTAYSVFTHTPIEAQDLWLQEIARILRPSGVFFSVPCSTNGLRGACCRVKRGNRSPLRAITRCYPRMTGFHYRARSPTSTTSFKQGKKSTKRLDALLTSCVTRRRLRRIYWCYGLVREGWLRACDAQVHNFATEG